VQQITKKSVAHTPPKGGGVCKDFLRNLVHPSPWPGCGLVAACKGSWQGPLWRQTRGSVQEVRGRVDDRSEVWTAHRNQRREALAFFENVGDYPAELLHESFGHRATFLRADVDPRDLGYAAARTRKWALIVDNQKAVWDGRLSFHDMLEILAAVPIMKAKDRLM
jgi:hypothetical protein